MISFRAPWTAAGWSDFRKQSSAAPTRSRHARREARQFRRADSVALAERLLRKTRRRMGDLKIKATGWAAIEPGLKQSYQRGRDDCRLVRKQLAPEHFHGWRKHVKDLWYYFCFLRPALPAARAVTDELEMLGEQLGEDHDLFLLQQFIKEECAGQPEEANALNRLIESRQHKLRAAALKLGSLLYAESPAKFCRRMSRLGGYRE